MEKMKNEKSTAQFPHDLSYSQILETRPKITSKKSKKIARDLDSVEENCTIPPEEIKVKSHPNHSENLIASQTGSFEDEDEGWYGTSMQIGVESEQGNDYEDYDALGVVQPRKLASWVQDHAVSACFKCFDPFTISNRKHHCRACGRIFCARCSAQRLHIPEPIQHDNSAESYYYLNSLSSTTSGIFGSLKGIFPYSTSTESENALNKSLNSESEHCVNKILNNSSSETKSSCTNNSLQYDKNNLLTDAGSNPTSMSAPTSPFSSMNFSDNDSTPSNSRSIHLPPTPNSSISTPAVLNSGKSSLLLTIKTIQLKYPKTNLVFHSKESLRRRISNSKSSSSTTNSQIKKQESGGCSNVSAPADESLSRKQRVCDDCACVLKRRSQSEKLVSIFEIKEQKMLLLNQEYLMSHSKWMVQLVKSVDDWESYPHQSNTIAERVLKLLKKEGDKKCSCLMLMCSRLCNKENRLGLVESLELLQYSDDKMTGPLNQAIIELRDFCVDRLSATASQTWMAFLPILLHSLKMEQQPFTSKLGRVIMEQASMEMNIVFRSDLYWGLKVMAEDIKYHRKLNNFLTRFLFELHNKNKNWVEELLRGQELVDIFAQLPSEPSSTSSNNSNNTDASNSTKLIAKLAQENLVNQLQELKLFQHQENYIRLPVDPLVQISGLIPASLEIKNSAERPLIITCQQLKISKTEKRRKRKAKKKDHEEEQGQFEEKPMGTDAELPAYRVMFKRDDLRKDSIVQSIIQQMYRILSSEADFVDVDVSQRLVTYRVLPTSTRDGMIEIVPNAHTLYSIMHQPQLYKHTIQSFLAYHNRNRTLSQIAASFRESLAAYTVITFLLGVGDRHAHNVMLTQDGLVFHIDYGFILGKDPKPIQPPMRVDSDMIHALDIDGSHDGLRQFQELCVKYFNTLRRHVTLFMIMLNLVVKATPEITDFGLGYSQHDLETFVIERFLPGQSDDEARIALLLRMEGRGYERIGLHVSDFIHAQQNEETIAKSVETIKSGVNHVVGTASSLFQYMWTSR